MQVRLQPHLFFFTGQSVGLDPLFIVPPADVEPLDQPWTEDRFRRRWGIESFVPRSAGI